MTDLQKPSRSRLARQVASIGNGMHASGPRLNSGRRRPGGHGLRHTACPDLAIIAAFTMVTRAAPTTANVSRCCLRSWGPAPSVTGLGGCAPSKGRGRNAGAGRGQWGDPRGKPTVLQRIRCHPTPRHRRTESRPTKWSRRSIRRGRVSLPEELDAHHLGEHIEQI